VHQCIDKFAAAELVNAMNEGDVVLVKASRSEKLEELALLITEKWQGRTEGAADRNNGGKTS
jgi:UDP-N-acetylmuramoyl-tripeptide--D-alanyl-D-alanine ligase